MKNLVREVSVTFTRPAAPTPTPTPTPTPEPKKYVGWRVRYTREGGNVNPLGMPAATPAQRNGYKYIRPVEFTRRLQEYSWGFTQHTNKLMSRKNWRAFLQGNVMLTNYQGWVDNPDPDKQVHRADYVNNQDLEYEDPRLMDAIVSGGNFLTGFDDGYHIRMRPGVDGIDVNAATLPTYQEILDRNWYIILTNNTTNPSHFFQGQGGPVYFPYYLVEEAFYSNKYMQPWDQPFLPDPVKIYELSA